MSTAATPPAREPTPPAVTNYVILCLAALGVVLLAELERLNLVTLLALLLGLGGVLGRTRLTPVLFLGVLTISQVFAQLQFDGFGGAWSRRPWVFRPTDLLLCAAGLAFILGHFRLQSLTQHLLPTDPRDRRGKAEWDWWSLGRVYRLVMHRRSADLVTAGEFALVGLAVLLAVAVAFAGWVMLVQPRNVGGLPPNLGRVVLVGWLLAVGGYVAAALLGYWRRCRMSREQGLLILQDMLWRTTRQEQRHENQDAARQRWRRQQGKGEPS
jgi:hypothetical protein